jgi:cell wall-associated NlpC family hydrolase
VIPAWVSPYVGLPFSDHGRGPEYDCWGLVRLVWSEHYHLQLPDFGDAYTYTTDPAIAGAFHQGTVEHGLELVSLGEEQEGDILLITAGGKPMHCGLVVDPPFMLHARPKVGSCVESYERPYWNRRIGGFYRPRFAREASRATQPLHP